MEFLSISPYSPLYLPNTVTPVLPVSLRRRPTQRRSFFTSIQRDLGSYPRITHAHDAFNTNIGLNPTTTPTTPISSPPSIGSTPITPQHLHNPPLQQVVPPEEHRDIYNRICHQRRLANSLDHPLPLLSRLALDALTDFCIFTVKETARSTIYIYTMFLLPCVPYTWLWGLYEKKLLFGGSM